MEIFNLKKENEIETHGLHIAYGMKASGLSDKSSSSLRSLLYTSTPGLLLAGDEEILLPPQSVTVIKSGIEAKLLMTPAEMDAPVVMFRVPDEKPHIPEEQAAKLENPYVINGSEWNTEIKEFLDGDIILYTDASRYVAFLLKKGKAVKSGWFTTAFKGQPLSVSDAVWTKPRLEEIAHYHNIIREAYVILDGTANLYVNGDIVPVPSGSLALTDLADTHKVDSVEVGSSGTYRHLCTQYPSITNDKGERVNVDNKEGFTVRG